MKFQETSNRKDTAGIETWKRRREETGGKKQDELVGAHHMMSADGLAFNCRCQVLKVPLLLQSTQLCRF